ncbi:MAG: type II secretion system F family protein [Lachnospiraceae bacterium]|nr:type II secretion system F family protein [Lachnospiraceae bacterium]
MAVYKYKVVDANGKNKKGDIEAQDQEQAISKLRSEGYTVISCDEAGMMDKDIQIGFLKKKVKPRDWSVFCKQFGSVLRAGVTIISALDMMSEQMDNKTLKNILLVAKAHVEKGGTLADGFKQSAKDVPDILISMVAAGELSGNLEVCFERLSTQFEKDGKLQAKIRGALTYPIIVLIVAVIVVIVMVVMVIPQFSDMFADMGMDLPAATKLLLWLSDLFRYRWWLVLGIVAVIVVLYKLFAASDFGKHFLGKFAIKVPIFGKMNVMTAAATTARTMSTLMASGIAMVDAVEAVAHMMSNILFEEALMDAKSQIMRGVPLSKPIRDCGIFPTMLPQMIKIGEETGNIEDMMDKVADYYEDQVDVTTDNVTAAMEPLTMVVMAGIVGVIVAGVYGPILSMYTGMDNL